MGCIIQVTLQWLFFTMTHVTASSLSDHTTDCNLRLYSFVLYLIYYPEHLKYVDIISHPTSYTDTTITTKHEKSAGWRLSVALGWATALHLYALPYSPSVLCH